MLKQKWLGSLSYLYFQNASAIIIRNHCGKTWSFKNISGFGNGRRKKVKTKSGVLKYELDAFKLD